MSEYIGEAVMIQGLGGAGKTTAAQMLAERDGYINLNTGTLFRAAAAGLLREGARPADAAAYVAEAAFAMDLSDARKPLIAIQGLDVSDLLQRPESTSLASVIGAQAEPSARLEAIFDHALTGERVVVEGKHLGGRVDAVKEHSIFLVAQRHVRAYRKWGQALESGRRDYSFRQAWYDTLANDARDARLLTVGNNTALIDTSQMEPLEVYGAIKRYISRNR